MTQPAPTTPDTTPAPAQPAGQADPAPVPLDNLDAPGHPLRAKDVGCFVDKEIG